ncbi:MAG: DUF3298 domain-containing protein [Clostridia bacterium]|nr:DUF3298 domain-containing protein [Clostridia bacterium]
MKKILLLISVFTLLLTGCALWDDEKPGPIGPDIPEESTTPITEDEGLAAKVIVETVPFNNRVGNIEISNEYPSIKSFKNKNFENSINTKIASNLADYRAEISAIVDDKTPDTKLYKYITTYERFNAGKYLTLIIHQDYQTGGIRSNTWKEIYNIDVTTERTLKLEELFDPTTDFEKAIIDEITSTSKVEFMGGDGLTRLPEDQKFYIKDGKLFIYFDPSEVASAKYGALEYEMPFTLGSDGHFKVD